ncbi:MAG: T9SS type A sorting domain-containing protein [Bacteroidales bacterium]|nr:T9SS type A sorting domain-containing protein [Candidatus Latescibacterota bacterium]
MPESDRPFLLNTAVYSTDKWIHPPVSEFSVHYLRGHAIATGTLTPVGYQPAAKAAGYWSEVTVIIETVTSSPTDIRPVERRNDHKTCERLSALVDNPGAVELMASTSSSSPFQYEYMIITSQALAGAFVELSDFYNCRGLKTRIVTTEYIETEFKGTDLCEKIRNAIKLHYSSYGIEYVLMGGDTDIVPYRGFRCVVSSDDALYMEDGVPSTIREDNRIPADIYFSNLDGKWNNNGDHLYGEVGEEDLYSEISVGRACVNSIAEASVFVRKSTMYQDTPVATHLRRALLLGEELNNDPATYGGDDLDELVDTCQAHGYSTTGLPPDFDITRFYDRDIFSWTGPDIVPQQVSAGTHLILHSGHCNVYYGLRLGTATITNGNFLNDGTNANFPIINTIGCLLGAFEVNDCLAEYITGIDNFALAIVCNSRWGWYTPGSTDGASHHYQREFVDAIFGEDMTRLGSAHARSKDETAVYLTLPIYAEEGVMRWCFYCLNLLGDPAIDVWTDIPTDIIASHEDAIMNNDAFLPIETNVPFSRGTISWNGRCYASTVGDASGAISIDLAGTLPADTDSLLLSVTAHNWLTYYSIVTVHGITGEEETPTAGLALHNSPNPFNPNTLFVLSIPVSDHVDLRIYDVAGREVSRVVDREMDAGTHKIVWTPENISSGVYFCIMKSSKATITRKIVLMR